MNRQSYEPRVLIFLTVAAAVLLGLGLAGCSDSTDIPASDPVGSGGALVTGGVDPGAGSFVLQTLTIAPDRLTRIPIQLIGNNLVVTGDSNQVALDVAIRNLWSGPLYSPALVAIYDFAPGGVLPVNADGVIVPMGPDGSPIGEDQYYYNYSDQMGDDGMLAAGETSEARTWIFDDPALVSFSFGARAEFGLEPDRPRIGGVCFWDRNANGIRDPEDGPMPAGLVFLTTPGGETTRTYCDDQGTYSFPVHQSSLYTLTFDPLIDTLIPIFFTTPYPLQVLLTPGPDGLPNSYLEAHFGMANQMTPRPEPVQFTDLPADSLQQVHWNFIDAEVLPDITLRMRVGLSGCQPVQPASLYMSGGFMESEPVQANIVFVNESQEVCGAYWETSYDFDLAPLYRQYLDAYGPGVVVLNLRDFQGLIHPLELAVRPRD